MRLPILTDLDPRTRVQVVAGLVAATMLLLGAAALLELRGDGSDSGAGQSPTASGTATATSQPEPPSTRVVLPAAALDAGDPADAAAVSALLGPLLADPDLGASVAASVVDAATGAPLLATGAASPQISASTVKPLSAVAALAALGPDHRFTTRVVAVSGSRTVTLVGGGDPTLADAAADAPAGGGSLAALAQQTAAGLRSAGVTGPVRVTYDAGLFSGPAVADGWAPGLIASGVVAPVSALTVTRPDGVAVADPAARTAALFTARLVAAGVAVTGTPVPAPAPTGAATLAAVESPTLDAVVEATLQISDNDAAEILARHVGIAAGGEGSFADGLPAVVSGLAGLGVDTAGISLGDASGLSRRTLVPAAALTATLDQAADRPSLRAVLVGLPVAGFTGTLSDRFDTAAATAGRGTVRAKTGTLTGVSGLAGTVTTADGRLLLFAFLADEVPGGGTEAARGALDTAAAALAGCGC